MTRSRFLLVLIGAAITVVALFTPICFAVNREFWQRLMDAAHVPFFAAFTCFLIALLPTRLTFELRVKYAAAIAAGVAVAVELIQPLTGRGESLTDVVNGLFGIVIAVTGWSAWRHRKRWPWQLPALHLIVSLLLAFIALHPAWREGRGITWRHTHFPLLGDFESDDELRLWTPSEHGARMPRPSLNRSRDFASRGQCSLQIDLPVAEFPGVNFDAGDADWRGKVALAFDVFNPGASLSLALRIDEATAANRYRESIPLAPGWNRIRLPIDEIARDAKPQPLGLDHIRCIVLFVESPREPRTLFLDHVRLE